MSRQGIGSGRWARLWLVVFEDRRRWFHTQDSADKFAASVRDAGGHAEVKHWTVLP